MPVDAENGRLSGRTGSGRHTVKSTRMPSRPREFHPEPLTEPDLTLSRHPAPATARRLPPECQVRFCEGLGVKFPGPTRQDRKSTRLNSSHQIISYAVF